MKSLTKLLAITCLVCLFTSCEKTKYDIYANDGLKKNIIITVKL